MAENAGIKRVREKKCLSGILEVTAKKIGTTQINRIYERLKISKEATIIETIATSLARGFIVCSSPFLLLKSSM
jgi:hypothetical protein